MGIVDIMVLTSKGRQRGGLGKNKKDKTKDIKEK
jgi:hypothetical protein